MANSKTYRIDPNSLTQQALDGTAELPADPTASIWPKIFAAVNRAGYESVDTSTTAPAADVDLTEWAITGTDVATLAAPTYAGQRKTIRIVLAASIPTLTLTVSSPDDTAGFVCPATFVFNTVGQEITFEATPALKWRCVAKKRAGVIATITAGTTVLTGYSMNEVYSLAVDGTDAGTGTGGLPDGAVAGEECSIVCELAANTPVGSLSGTFKGVFGTAYTAFGAIGVVGSTTVIGDYGRFKWDGAAWQVTNFAGCTFS